MPVPVTQFRQRLFPALCLTIVMALAAGGVRRDVRAQTEPAVAKEPIFVSADVSQVWIEDGVRVSLFRGHCHIVQGDTSLGASQMVVWQTADGQNDRITVYLEQNVRLERPGSSINQPSLLIDLSTGGEVVYRVRAPVTGQAAGEDALYRRSLQQRSSSQRKRLQQTQLKIDEKSTEGPLFQSVTAKSPSKGQRVQISPRGGSRPEIISFPSQSTTPPEQVSVITGGVNVLITGLEEDLAEHGGGDAVDLMADRVVIWTDSSNPDNPDNPELGFDQDANAQLQIYLEGNVVIRQANNELRAERAFFDKRESRGLLLDAELKYDMPQIKGKLRVRAERIRMRSEKQFHAQRAWVSTSPFGKPGVRLESSDIFIEPRYSQPWFGRAAGRFDPQTGAPIVEEVSWLEAVNNRFLVEDFPIFYTPYISAPAQTPNIPLRRASVGDDDVYGTYVRTVWDMYSLLGIDRPPVGTDWTLLLDGMTDRGVGIGTQGEYEGSDILGAPGSFEGDGLAYFIHDVGDDNLGRDRRALDVPNNNRSRFQWHHQQELPYQVALAAEVGYVSDRNFLEQYWEREFKKEKDNETYAELKQTHDDWSWSLLTKGRLNDFSNVTEWYPRLDGHVLGEPLLGGLLTWSSHSYAGYGRARTADAPSDPADVFTSLPYANDVAGGVAMTRHQLEVPLNVGALKVTPFLLGEAAHWEEDASGDDLDRLYASLGVRSSLMVWKAMPYVRNRLLNVNGLAHKVLFEVDYMFADANQDFTDMAYYNDFDDNAQERFRERFITNTFGGAVPMTADPRFYAIRNNTGSSVSSPWHELVDDFQVLRFAVRQRLQTKVGPPENLRIIDWMTFDVATSFFPEAGRDNFGEDLGLITGDYRWNVGSRTSILAHAQTDFYDGAEHLWNIGVRSQRSERGSLYFGFSQVRAEGINSQFIRASASYQMSAKWLSSVSTSYDLGENRNVGQSFMITRVGPDFRIHVGGTVNPSKDSTGFAFIVEPTFLPFTGANTSVGGLVGGETP